MWNLHTKTVRRVFFFFFFILETVIAVYRCNFPPLHSKGESYSFHATLRTFSSLITSWGESLSDIVAAKRSKLLPSGSVWCLWGQPSSGGGWSGGRFPSRWYWTLLAVEQSRAINAKQLESEQVSTMTVVNVADATRNVLLFALLNLRWFSDLLTNVWFRKWTKNI